MQKSLIVIVVVAIVVVAGIVAAWQLTQVPSAEARPIKIGLVAGYQLAEGQDMDRAAKLAVKEINDAGGVYVAEWHTSVEIELVTINTEDDSPGKSNSEIRCFSERDFQSNEFIELMKYRKEYLERKEMIYKLIDCRKAVDIVRSMVKL